MITTQQYLHYLSRALDGMAEIVAGLGDELANTALPQPGSNSPYAVLNHCLGATDYWAGEVVAGRDAHRDRAAEFTASGPVAPLLDRVTRTIAQLEHDLTQADPRGKPRNGKDITLPGLGPADQGGALLHLLCDLVQHHGQLEITRDAFVASVAHEGIAR